LAQYQKAEEFKERIRQEQSHLFTDFTKGDFQRVLENDLERWLHTPSHPWIETLRGDDGRPFDLKEKIDAAAEHIESGEAQVAIRILKLLKSERWNNADDHLRFRIVANLGHAHRLKGDLDVAAEFFIQAKEFAPDDENARCWAALGEYMKGNEQAAFVAASDVLSDNPNATLALEVWILSAPSTYCLNRIEQNVPKELINEVEVAFALAKRSLDLNEFDKAIAYGRIALSGAQESPEAQSLLGHILLQKQFTNFRGASELEEIHVNKKQLAEPIKLFTQAIEKYTQLGAKHEAASARLKRGLAHLLLGETSIAVRDYSVASELSPADPHVGLQFSILMRRTGLSQQGLRILRDLFAKTRDGNVAVSLAVALANEAGDSGLEQGIDLLSDTLKSWKSCSADVIREATVVLVEMLAAHGRTDSLSEVGTHESVSILDTVSELTLQAIICFKSEDLENSRVLALRAANQLKESTPFATTRRLAELLNRMGMYREAFSILKGIIDPTLVDDSVRLLLLLASRIENHQFILDFCKALRSNGIIDPYCAGMEARLLASYNDEAGAIQILEKLLDEEIDVSLAQEIRLDRSILALKIDNKEAVDDDLQKLPSSEEASAEIGMRVVWLLTELGRTDDAAAYAYSLFRHHPDSHFAHMAVIQSFCLGTDKEVKLPKFDKVDVGVGMTYQIDGGESFDWFIIEDSSNARITLNEIASDDPLAQRVMGMSVGEEFVLNPGAIQERTATIRRIEHRFVLRFQDSFKGWEKRFPSIPFLQRIDLQKDASGQLDFKDLVRLGEEKSKHIESVTKTYRENPLPLSCFAASLNLPIVRAIERIATDPHLQVRCCQPTGDAIKEAMSSLSSAEAIVIDSTALATLLLLDEPDLLGKIPIKLVVSSGTERLLRELLQCYDSPVWIKDGLVKKEGKYAVESVTEKNIDDFKNRDKKIYDAVLRDCVVESGTALASLESKERENVCELFGQAGAESLALAKGQKRIIWTDDLPMAVVAKQSHNSICVWTQVLVDWLASNGHISIKNSEMVSLDLLVAGYEFTILRSSAIIQAADQAGWDSNRSPLAEMINYIAIQNISDGNTFNFVGHILKDVWMHAGLEDSALKLTLAILESTAKRSKGFMVIDQLRKSLDLFFGLDVVHAAKCRKVIEGWLDRRIQM
jgi:tetratricopeptide (TPR) repeat protein